MGLRGWELDYFTILLKIDINMEQFRKKIRVGISVGDLNGIGRFYLHTTSETLSSDDLINNNNISIYSSSRENLRIVGVQNGIANVQLYTILGKEVLRSSFEGTGMNDIQLPSLAEGVYIVHLSTTNGTINKKVIIQ